VPLELSSTNRLKQTQMAVVQEMPATMMSTKLAQLKLVPLVILLVLKVVQEALPLIVQVVPLELSSTNRPKRIQLVAVPEVAVMPPLNIKLAPRKFVLLVIPLVPKVVQEVPPLIVLVVRLELSSTNKPKRIQLVVVQGMPATVMSTKLAQRKYAPFVILLVLKVVPEVPPLTALVVLLGPSSTNKPKQIQLVAVLEPVVTPMNIG